MRERTAYDYDAQEWVIGPEALAIMIRQTEETITILAGDAGQLYADAIGASLLRCLRDARDLLDELEREARPWTAATTTTRSDHHV